MSKRVVVVGGGVIGLSVAYHCLQRGHRVTLIERGARERDDCSFANAGMVVPSHVVPLASPGAVKLGLSGLGRAGKPLYVKPRLSAELFDWGWKFCRASTRQHVERSAPVLRDLHLASRECYRKWATRWSNEFELQQHGLLMLCATEHGLAEEAAIGARARGLGIPAETLTAAAAATLEPNIRMRIAGAVFYPMDCHLTPGRLMALLAREVERLGARSRFNATAGQWQVDGGTIRSVEAAGETIAADEFVIAAGMWSKDIARSLGFRLPMQSGKGYSLTIDTPAGVAQPHACAILSEARLAMTPMGSSLRFGGTMEMTGIDETIDRDRVRGIANAVSRYYPDFTPPRFEATHVRAGLRPCSPDGLPYIGRVSRFANLSVATGHAMMGISLAPITGKLIAEMLSGQPLSCSVAGLDPDRYA